VGSLTCVFWNNGEARGIFSSLRLYPSWEEAKSSLGIATGLPPCSETERLPCFCLPSGTISLVSSLVFVLQESADEMPAPYCSLNSHPLPSLPPPSPTDPSQMPPSQLCPHITLHLFLKLTFHFHSKCSI